MQYGSWQIGPIGQTLRKEARFARLRSNDWRCTRSVFYHGPVMEVLSLEEFAKHERFHTLGPDLLHENFSVDAGARTRCTLRETARSVTRLSTSVSSRVLETSTSPKVSSSPRSTRAGRRKPLRLMRWEVSF